jgi:hypothetical protein
MSANVAGMIFWEIMRLVVGCYVGYQLGYCDGRVAPFDERYTRKKSLYLNGDTIRSWYLVSLASTGFTNGSSQAGCTRSPDDRKRNYDRGYS